MRRIITVIAGLVMLACTAPSAAQQADRPEMTHERYAAYLTLFNAADPNYADYYDPDIVFYHDPMFGVLRGREAILAFYRKLRGQLDEHVTARTVVIDHEKQIIAAELSTKLVAKVDGIAMPSGFLNKGDMIISEGTVYYAIKDGRIAEIRSSISGGRKILASDVGK